MMIGFVLISVMIYILLSKPQHTANRYKANALDILQVQLAKGEADTKLLTSCLNKQTGAFAW